MKPALSIVVAVYNAAPWLCRCLDSLRNQTFTDWEALLVDDGSCDASADICREFAARDKRFRFLKQPHSGVVLARRSGVLNALGDRVGFVDADDWVEPDMYSEMMAAASGAEAVVCGYFTHSGDLVAAPPVFPGEGTYGGASYETLILNEMLCARDRSCFDSTPVLWNKLLPTHLVRQTMEKMDERMRRGEDALCVYTCLMQIGSLACIERPLYHYRVHSSSVMRRVGFSSYLDTALFYRQLTRAASELSPALLPQADSLFLYLISLGANENPELLGYPKVREALRRERLQGCCREWRRRVFYMRLKGLFAPRAVSKEKLEDYV